MHLFRILLALAIIGCANLGQATIISTADGLGADAFVQAIDSELNYNNTSLTLKNGNTADQYARKAYLRFDLAAISGQTVQDATLRMAITTNNLPAGQTYTVQVFGLDDGFAGVDKSSPLDGDVAADVDIHNEFWSETLIDWNGAPANVTTSGYDLNSNATLLGSFTINSTDSAGTVMPFSNASLVSFLNADTNGVVNFILRRSGTNAGGSYNLSFASKEHATQPEPTLEVTTVPEPSALLLLAAGLIGMALYRRRGARQ